jgi:hypothetical protein
VLHAVAFGLPHKIPISLKHLMSKEGKLVFVVERVGNLQTFTPCSITRLPYPQVNKIKERLQSGGVVLIDIMEGKVKTFA